MIGLIWMKKEMFMLMEKLNEPYLSKKAYGKTNITFPYQVPEDRIFVMGITVKCRLIHEILLSERFQMSKLLDV